MRNWSLTIIGAIGLILLLWGGPTLYRTLMPTDARDDAEDTGASHWLPEAIEDARALARVATGVHLRVPPQAPLLVQPSQHVPKSVPAGARRAHAYHFMSRVYARPSKRPQPIGYVTRGMVLHALDRVSGPGCAGKWYELASRGVVCSAEGFSVSRERREVFDQRPPDVGRALPFRYAKVVKPDALRFHRIPTLEEEQTIESLRDEGELAALFKERKLPDVVQEHMAGVFLLALDREERDQGRAFVRTVRGRYVRMSDLEDKSVPLMRGVLLEGEKKLPYAFVYRTPDEPAPVYQLEGKDELRRVGVADVHARIAVNKLRSIAGHDYVIGPERLALPRKRLRIARQVKRPRDVPRGAKWIHVDLAEQVLVAYEGDNPVFATLVSSGKGEEFATPTGLFRISAKHISTTMSGPDPDHGVYEVGEVPWTLFYHDSYALHGAYWHDDFGQTRSHGCTNISPVDARWLFYWTDGELPRGWNAIRNFQGTWVSITNERAVAQDLRAL